MKKKWVLISATVFALALGTSAHAFEGGFGAGPCPMGGHRGGGFHKPGSSEVAGKFFHKAYFLVSKQEELGLSDDQMKTIKDLTLDAKKSAIRSFSDIAITDLDIQAKLHDPKVDTASVNKLIDQKYDAKKAFDKEMVDHIAKLKSVLTEQQQKTLKDLKKHHGRHGFKGQDRPEETDQGEVSAGPEGTVQS